MANVAGSIPAPGIMKIAGFSREDLFEIWNSYLRKIEPNKSLYFSDDRGIYIVEAENPYPCGRG